jgi:hypothetical protein
MVFFSEFFERFEFEYLELPISGSVVLELQRSALTAMSLIILV